MENREVFLCHVSEDKRNIVDPLAEAFQKAGISCWYDKTEIAWGDNLLKAVNDGLNRSHYVIVVISKSFISKESRWAENELNASLNIEFADGKVRVLPLLVGSDSEVNEILSNYPFIKAKSYLVWENDPLGIVSKLQIRMAKDSGIEPSSKVKVPSKILVPKVRKSFTQIEKDKFIKNSFSIIRSYLKEALYALENENSHVQTDLTEFDSFKFICTIYVDGDIKTKCQIWVRSYSTDSIYYSEGNHNLADDGSYNDWLTIKDDGFKLGLHPSGWGFSGSQFKDKDTLTPEEAGAYLWQRVTENL